MESYVVGSTSPLHLEGSAVGGHRGDKEGAIHVPEYDCMLVAMMSPSPLRARVTRVLRKKNLVCDIFEDVFKDHLRVSKRWWPKLCKDLS